MKSKISIFWFRRDLRLEDNVGLYHALAGKFPVLPIFIFDTTILDDLENKHDRRVDYIHQALTEINLTLKKHHSKLTTFYGKPFAVFKTLEEQYDIQAIFCNRDYEPYAIQRDTEVYQYFTAKQIPFKAFNDQVIFEKHDIVKKDGTPYTVFTPYAKRWRGALQTRHYTSVKISFDTLFQQPFSPIHSLSEIGFEKTTIQLEKPILNKAIIADYHKYRDYPAMQHTTQLGICLRFGTISVRQCVAFALEHNQIWLNELIWREFFMQILYHFPHVVTQSFKKQYDHIEWRNDEQEFERWREGKTGFPIVDAGMRQLNQTGYMHNRVRMIVASFLCKHLLIDWRWGEAYFAQKLDDYDLSANNGNWQWAAGCGCDAAPYFRIFSPDSQTEKFDKEFSYIKKWVPEFNTPAYPSPMVDNKAARARALQTYQRAVKTT